MDNSKDQEWVIEEDELALENSVFQKHKGEYEPRTPKRKRPISFPTHSNISTIKETKEKPYYIGEKITFSLLLSLFPYFLGMFLFFILVPFLFAINISILFLAIDFWDWAIHFLFWSIGFIILSFSGGSLLLYHSRD